MFASFVPGMGNTLLYTDPFRSKGRESHLARESGHNVTHRFLTNDSITDLSSVSGNDLRGWYKTLQMSPKRAQPLCRISYSVRLWWEL